MKRQFLSIPIAGFFLFASCSSTSRYYQLQSDVYGYKDTGLAENADVVKSGNIVQHVPIGTTNYIRVVDSVFYQHIEAYGNPDSLLQEGPLRRFFSEKYFLEETDRKKFRKKHKRLNRYPLYISPFDI